MGLPPTESVGLLNDALAHLGQRLFSDQRLSVDGTVSCASCHLPSQHFSDGRDEARAPGRQPLTRHTPTLLNVRYESSFFWDGRATDLAAQARGPLLGREEHGFADEQAVASVVRNDPAYAADFQRLFGVGGTALSIREVTAALAEYEKSLVAGNSPFDRYLYAGDSMAMDPSAIRGLALFRGRAQCESCHRIGKNWSLLTDGGFHASAIPLPETTLVNVGALSRKVAALREQGATDALNALISSDRDIAALGRFNATLDPKDIGLYKTPSLRNVAVTGPYMHDGSVTDLPRAIELELYSRGARNYPLVLTEDERADLLHFLEALTTP
jgi:cytochrome c peroxidase